QKKGDKYMKTFAADGGVQPHSQPHSESGNPDDLPSGTREHFPADQNSRWAQGPVMKDRPSIHALANSPASTDRQMLAPVGELRPSVWALLNEALRSPLISTGRNGLRGHQTIRSPEELHL